MAEVITYKFSRITLTETWGLRAAVLWPEKDPGPTCQLATDDLPDTVHYGVKGPTGVVSIGTFAKEVRPELPTGSHYRLRAMATDQEHRERGVGRMLIEGALTELSELGCSIVWADARHVALGFYARLNWDVIGPTYEVPLRGPHRLVWRSI